MPPPFEGGTEAAGRSAAVLRGPIAVAESRASAARSAGRPRARSSAQDPDRRWWAALVARGNSWRRASVSGLRLYLLHFSWALTVHVSLPLHLQDFNPHRPSPSHFDLLRGVVEENGTTESCALGKEFRASYMLSCCKLWVEME